MFGKNKAKATENADVSVGSTTQRAVGASCQDLDSIYSASEKLSFLLRTSIKSVSNVLFCLTEQK